ncbi:MAG: hypothetical protein RLZZ584_2766 [Pseudomonadota bacterium]
MAIYLGSRDLNGVPIGTHQFLVLTGHYLLACRANSAREAEARYLGKQGGQDVYGVVVGAHKVGGKLVVKYFEDADLAATMEYFGGRPTSFFSSDFDAEMFPVAFGTLPDTASIERVLECIENYRTNVSESPIDYPTLGVGFNSNSWAQSVVQYTGGSTTEDSSGLDVSSGRRIPQIYFENYCAVRPRVN